MDLSHIKKGVVPWFFPLELLERYSPSRNSMNWSKEFELRLEASKFIQKAGEMLNLPFLTQATGIVLFQRFYTVKSFEKYPYQNVCLAGLFLAGKKEETFCHIRELVRKTYPLLYPNKFLSKEDDQELSRLCKKLLDLENDLLHVISFDLEIDHPYDQVVDYIKKLKSDKTYQSTLAQTAWNFINDCYRKTIFCILYPPNIISAAVLSLAAQFLNFKLPVDGQNPFWKHFGTTRKVVQEISLKIQNMYMTKDLERIKQSIKENLKSLSKNSLQKRNSSKKYEIEQRIKSRKRKSLESSMQPTNNTSKNEKLGIDQNQNINDSIDIHKEIEQDLINLGDNNNKNNENSNDLNKKYIDNNQLKKPRNNNKK
ncbi:cyclin [Anaeramoeba flamelloides]|uniref:Cyclin n=1 Tax=Anaeramoeba flamelloides TaxID=1746091 RepID=A0AAV8A5I6_9EUKA|nr:cyclin [Anaeramoeba flamelloides]